MPELQTCPLCRQPPVAGGTKQEAIQTGTEQLHARVAKFPLVAVLRTPRDRRTPKDAKGRTFRDIRGNPRTEKAWIAELYDEGMTAHHLANKGRDLHRSFLFVVRRCSKHGLFVTRNDNQGGCQRCANSRNCAFAHPTDEVSDAEMSGDDNEYQGLGFSVLDKYKHVEPPKETHTLAAIRAQVCAAEKE